jgi:thymidine kinase
MGAGKSLDLLKTAYNYEERDKNVVLLTSSLDDRYGINKITSRVGISKDAYGFDSSTNLFEFVSEYCFACECVFIDESQFLTKEQVWQLVSKDLYKLAKTAAYLLTIITTTDLLTDIHEYLNIDKTATD